MVPGSPILDFARRLIGQHHPVFPAGQCGGWPVAPDALAVCYRNQPVYLDRGADHPDDPGQIRVQGQEV